MSQQNKQKNRFGAMSENARIANLEYVNGMIAEITNAKQNGYLSDRAADELLEIYYALNIRYSR